MTALATIPVAKATRLEELAAIIRREDGDTVARFAEAYLSAVRAGEALIEARPLVPKGQWERWIAERTGIDRRRAWSYQLIAAHRAEIEEWAARQYERPTIDLAQRYLREIGASLKRSGKANTYSVEVRDEARRLRREGVSVADVAQILEVSSDTVQMWTNPEFRARRIEAQKQRHATRRAAERALRKREKESARQDTVKVSKPASEAYALIRQCALLLDRALAESDGNVDARVSFRKALDLAHKAEDEIVRASRLLRGAA